MRKLQRFSPITISTYALGIVVTAAVIFAAIDFYDHPTVADSGARSIRRLIRMIHEKTIDLRMTARGPMKGADDIVILAIDDETLRLEGRWPWPRDKTAKLIDRTMIYGAKSVSFDMIFSEPDNNSALPALVRLQKALRESKNEKSKAKSGNAKNSDLAITDALNEEASKADLDRIFANTIRANQDSLIMGSFFPSESELPPQAELCLDGYYDRLYASRYWSKEAIQVKVDDKPLNELNYPRAIRSHLPAYFLSLEVEAANVWFEKNPDASQRIKRALSEFGELSDPSLFPGLSVLVVNNDFESGQTLMEQMNPSLNSLEGVRSFYALFSSALDAKQTASLTSSLQKASVDYCFRFFSDKDELLHENEYIKKWGASPEAKEQFNTLSWDSFWKHLPLKPNEPPETAAVTIARIKKEIIPNELPETLRWELAIPTLADATKHTGYFNAFQDTDGSIRRTRLLTRYANNYEPSLAYKTFLLNRSLGTHAEISRDTTLATQNSSRVMENLEAQGADGKTALEIPVDSFGNMLINYSGPQHMFAHISATDVLSDSEKMRITQYVKDPKSGVWADETKWVDKKKFLKDKMVFFGLTAIAVFDLRVTPFDGNFPGVETHANILSNLMVEARRAAGEKVDPNTPGFLKTVSFEKDVMWIVLLVMGFVLAGLISYLGSVAGLSVTALFLAGIYITDKYYLFQEGILVAALFPTSLVVLEFVTLTFFKYFTEERTKRELKGTFEKYVSPAIVAEVLADPSNLELGGKKVELTVMFSDVRGFTTISEKLDPRALSDLLNSYLTPMTNLVFKHKGTLDKYMGDAIMSFWGAPVHFPDHAEHACRCALAMLVKLKELAAEYKAKGLPEIDIGIGLNTGEMSVGNMGSDTVRSYTVMGDAVNLGSRLEGINKQYGTRIIISEFTHKAVEKKFVCREIDWVKVKGKYLPVRIFELLAEGKAPPLELETMLKNFNQGFQLYHERKFTEAVAYFMRALQAFPDDAPSLLYLERCQDYTTTPPPDDWDGVFTMTSK